MSKNTKKSNIAIKKLLIIGGAFLLIVAGLVGTFTFININEAPSLQVQQQADISIPLTPANAGSEASTMALLSGEFKDGDAVHSGTGTVTIVNSPEGPILVFGKDFKVTNGPDLLVYLSPNAANEPLGEFASLGKLKSTSGEQAYNLPDNYEDYKTVVVWCRAFSITFATAELQ